MTTSDFELSYYAKHTLRRGFGLEFLKAVEDGALQLVKLADVGREIFAKAVGRGPAEIGAEVDAGKIEQLLGKDDGKVEESDQV